MLAAHQFNRSISSYNHEFDRVPLVCQKRDEIECGVITPVKILQDEYERRVRGDSFKGARDLAQHPLTRCSSDFSIQRLAFRRSYKRRHLSEPHRSMCP